MHDSLALTTFPLMVEFRRPDNRRNRSNRDEIRFDSRFRRFLSFLAAGSRERAQCPQRLSFALPHSLQGPGLWMAPSTFMNGTIHV